MLKTLSGRNPSQNEYELRCFIATLENAGVKSYLEIGARHGDTFVEVVQHLPHDGVYVAVDLPGGLWGKKSSKNALINAASHLSHAGYKVGVHFDNSQAHDFAGMLAHKYGRFDAVLIDGDHTYEGVKRDWELYRAMGNIVAFHDIVGDGMKEKVHGNPVEVPRLWEEIKAQGFKTQEFIAPDSKMGIGCVFL